MSDTEQPTPRGWYTDPHNAGQERWWDGEQWDKDSPTRPKAPPSSMSPSEDSSQSGVKGWWARLSTRAKVAIIAAIVALGVIGSVTSEEETTDDQAAQEQSDNDEATSANGEDDEEQEEADNCTDQATSDCTPRVGPDETVRVDALTWQVLGAETRSSIGDQEFGLGAEANGIYVVVDLEVSSDRDESVTLTDGLIQLVVDGNTYDPDTSGTTAAIGAGEDPLFLEDIGPNSTLQSRVVFDVPESVLAQDPELRFGELGFGSTEGFIELPGLR